MFALTVTHALTLFINELDCFVFPPSPFRQDSYLVSLPPHYDITASPSPALLLLPPLPLAEPQLRLTLSDLDVVLSPRVNVADIAITAAPRPTWTLLLEATAHGHQICDYSSLQTTFATVHDGPCGVPG